MLLTLWLVFQIVSAFGESGGVAWWAHIGGFVAGAVLIVPFRRKTVALFGGSPQPRGLVFRRYRRHKTESSGPWGKRG